MEFGGAKSFTFRLNINLKSFTANTESNIIIIISRVLLLIQILWTIYYYLWVVTMQTFNKLRKLSLPCATMREWFVRYDSLALQCNKYIRVNGLCPFSVSVMQSRQRLTFYVLYIHLDKTLIEFQFEYKKNSTFSFKINLAQIQLISLQSSCVRKMVKLKLDNWYGKNGSFRCNIGEQFVLKHIKKLKWKQMNQLGILQ